MTSEEIVCAVDIVKAFPVGEGFVRPVDGLSLSLARGEFVAIVGQSGSGKSTLLNLLTGLDRPDAGQVRITGELLGDLRAEELARLRLERIGIVFQFFNLLPTLTIAQNVAVPGQLLKLSAREVQARVSELLSRVHIDHLAQRLPHEVSGGEIQRAAIARALFNKPAVVFADEPTGNLDPETATEVLTLLRELVHDEKLSLLVVTHDRQVWESADRVLRLLHGKLEAGAA